MVGRFDLQTKVTAAVFVMHRVLLIHWNAAEAEISAAKLRSFGYDVTGGPPTPGTLRNALRDNPPAAILIDLSRLPMQGRDVAMAFRHSKSTRDVSLVFVGGDPEKVARIKQQLPDAIYSDWKHVRAALKRAIEHPPAITTVPRSALDGYAGTPLAKKLGIKPDSLLALVNAPREFASQLGELPKGVRIARNPTGQPDLTLWFVRSREQLEREVDSMTRVAAKGGLWILWPKKTSASASDLTQAVVRKLAMASSLVDFKIAAIDSTWSGLRFTLRRSTGVATR